jgi:hypothetical protein
MKYFLPLFILLFTFAAFGNINTDIPNEINFLPKSRQLPLFYSNWQSSKTQNVSTVADCTYSLSQTSVTTPSSGGTGSFNVITQAGCTWTAVSNYSLAITFTSATSGSGNGTVSFTVFPNTSEQRTITITAGGQSFTITQLTGCTYRFSPSLVTQYPRIHSAGPESGNLPGYASPQSGCSNPSYTTNVSWITINPETRQYSLSFNPGETRSGSITINPSSASSSLTITQNACAYTVTTYIDVPAIGGIITANITTSSGCTWSQTYPPYQSWFSVISGSSGTGSGTITMSVAPNTGPDRRYVHYLTGTTPNAFGPANGIRLSQSNGCAYEISSNSANYTGGGGPGSFNLTSSNTECPFTASSSASWVTINSAASGTGHSSINYTVQPNTGPARTATITVGGKTFTVTQDANCIYSLIASSTTVSANNTSSLIDVIAATGCNWTAVSNSSWISISSGISGSGSGIVSFSVQPNTGLERIGTITVAGKTFTVTQSAFCTYSLNANSSNATSEGGNGSVNITAQSGCAWSAISNNPSWISINTNGNGGGTVTYTVAANTGAERIGTITIAGQTFTITQAGNGSVTPTPTPTPTSTPSSCTITLSPTNLTFSAQASTGSFAVTVNTCAWTASTTASWITINSANGTGNASVSISVVANTGPARTASITVNGQTFTVNQDAGAAQRRVTFDFDGDGKADYSTFRPELGEWWYLRSIDGGNRAFQFGSSDDKMVPADYTGDGKTDVAFYRPEKGEWFILRSEDYSYYSFPFGIAEDIPAPADYDGDQKADAAVYRPSTNTWYVMKSTGGFAVEQFGASGDVPVVADYNGDGKADLALYNKSTSTWKTKTANSSTTLSLFRESTQKAVPADYTGDGKADIAFYNPANGEWYIIRSENQTSYTVSFGGLGDIPTPADIDGDGKTDLVIYRPSTATWWYSASASGGQHRATQFGISTDKPVPNAYVR